GEVEVTEIEVSTDAGLTWSRAKFFDPAQRHAWRRWKFDWLTPKKPGRYTLIARAKSADGSVQPEKHEQNYGSYVVNHPLPIEVFVSDSRDTLLRTRKANLWLIRSCSVPARRRRSPVCAAPR